MGTEMSQFNGWELVALVKGAAAGDGPSFEELVERTHERCRRIAFPIVGPDLVEDALQETYLLIYQRLKQLNHPEAFMGWLSRIVLRVCYDIRKRHPECAEVPERLPTPDPTEDLVKSLTLRRALARVPQHDREVLILHELVGLSHAEVGYALQIPEGTARSRLHTARKRLAEQLQHEQV